MDKTIRIDDRITNSATALYPHQPIGLALESHVTMWQFIRRTSLMRLKGYFTKNEWWALFDTLNGTLLTEQFRGNNELFAWSIEENDRYEALFEKWEIDKDQILSKIIDLHSSDLAVLEEEISRIWHLQKDDTIDKFIEEYKG